MKLTVTVGVGFQDSCICLDKCDISAKDIIRCSFDRFCERLDIKLDIDMLASADCRAYTVIGISSCMYLKIYNSHYYQRKEKTITENQWN